MRDVGDGDKKQKSVESRKNKLTLSFLTPECPQVDILFSSVTEKVMREILEFVKSFRVKAVKIMMSPPPSVYFLSVRISRTSHLHN